MKQKSVEHMILTFGLLHTVTYKKLSSEAYINCVECILGQTQKDCLQNPTE